MHVSKPKTKSKPRKIVCTCGTTVPRFKYCMKMIRHLYNQTVPIDFIYINLHTSSAEKKLRAYLQVVAYCKRHPKIILTEVSHKLGPIARVYPTLLKETKRSTK